jgi:hypothetical protein
MYCYNQVAITFLWRPENGGLFFVFLKKFTGKLIHTFIYTDLPLEVCTVSNRNALYVSEVVNQRPPQNTPYKSAWGSCRNIEYLRLIVPVRLAIVIYIVDFADSTIFFPHMLCVFYRK